MTSVEGSPSEQLPCRVSKHRFARRVVVAASLALAFAAVLLPGSSIAAGSPPEFLGESASYVYATRAIVLVGYASPNLSSEWESDYAPAEAGGQAPPENSGAWVMVNTGAAKAEFDTPMFLGFPDAKDPRGGVPYFNVLRDLSPGAKYYARFVVKNADGEARRLVPFTTLPAGKPEVHVRLSGGWSTPAETLAFEESARTAARVSFGALVETNGADTAYELEYALPEGGHAPAASSPAWQPFTSKASGTITAAEEYAWVEGEASGLTPETTYYVRLRASNVHGEKIQTEYTSASGPLASSFTTLTAKPQVGLERPRNVNATSAYLPGGLSPDESPTTWRFEWSESPSGPWSPVPGGSGSISEALAASTPYNTGFRVGSRLSGLKAATTYYVRGVAENTCAAGCGATVSAVTSFETAGPPTAGVFAVHGLHGESVRVMGQVNPRSPVSTAEQVISLAGATGGTFTLSFKGHVTEPIPYDATANEVLQALRRLEGEPGVSVEGLPGGPYTVSFSGKNVQGAQPTIEASGLGLNPGATVSVAVTQPGGVGYDAHYHFQYVSQQSFAEHGWAQAADGPEEDAGSGDEARYVGSDLPNLAPGGEYRYRLIAQSNAPGTGPVYSGEGSLTVPTPVSASGPGSCPNEAFRSGASAHLPDCRAYELVSPAGKEGAQEPFHYFEGTNPAYFETGEDGQHVVLEAGVSVLWGTVGQSPYLFSRQEGTGWQMTTGAPQPQTGPAVVEPQLYSADATQIAFRVSSGGQEQYKLGPVGGPYVTAAAGPSGQGEGWAGATNDFSKLVLGSTDRTLLGGEPVGTKSGKDLYEYTRAGGLVQLNVSGEPARTIGVCGAKMASGYEYAGLESSAHAISADGSRVFFEAVPGKNCSEPMHLYMRVNGSSTVDIGAYAFAGANAVGSEVLLQRGEEEFFLYDVEAETVKHLFNLHATIAPVLSSGFTDLYLRSGKELYRYDIGSEILSLLAVVTRQPGITESEEGVTGPQGEVSADGRYYYFNGGAAGLPGAGVMRYDSVENVIECIACSSSFAPQPKLPSFLNSTRFDGVPNLAGGLPEYRSVSADGDFAFFTTPAALVSQDVNEELAPHGGLDEPFFDPGDAISPSSDVYEWRRDGVDGCDQLQGCLALITDGRKGYHVDLLGMADEGRDVFFYTRSQLVGQDTDNSGDIYDARIDGGFAGPAPLPVECEGDACSRPPSAPNDQTPSSMSFEGAGNVTAPSAGKAKAKAKPGGGKRRQKGGRARKRKPARGSGRGAGARARKHSARRAK